MSDEKSRGQRGPFNAWWFASAVLVVGVLAALVLVLIFGNGGGAGGEADPTSPPAPSPSQTAEEEEATSEPTADTCGSLPADSNIPTDGPEAEWVNNKSLLTPQSSEFGPVFEGGETWGCYAHSPRGALFAAANFLSELFTAGDSGSVTELVEAAAIDNPGREIWLTENAGNATEPDAGSVAQFAGFRYDSVEADEVTLRVGFRQSGVTGYWKVSMVWDAPASTWKVDLERFNVQPQEDSLATYTEWSASR